MKALVARAVLALGVAGLSVAFAQGPVRIDGSSDAAADQSFQRMLSSLNAGEQQALLIALIQINFAGAESVRDTLRNPKMQHPSASQVRRKIAGMTAAQIIAFANKTATTKVFIEGQEPGVPPDLLRPLDGGTPSTDLADTTWILEDNINGHIKRDVYALHEDHTMTLIESDKTPSGASRWEQSGDEVRFSFNDGYSVNLGHIVDATTMKGDGGNKTGGRWTWSGTKR